MPRRLVDSVTISPDGKSVAAGCWDGKVRVWDIENAKEPKLTINFDGDYVHSGCLFA